MPADADLYPSDVAFFAYSAVSYMQPNGFSRTPKRTNRVMNGVVTRACLAAPSAMASSLFLGGGLHSATKVRIRGHFKKWKSFLSQLWFLVFTISACSASIDPHAIVAQSAKFRSRTIHIRQKQGARAGVGDKVSQAGGVKLPKGEEWVSTSLDIPIKFRCL